jgi:hypothetical protein
MDISPFMLSWSLNWFESIRHALKIGLNPSQLEPASITLCLLQHIAQRVPKLNVRCYEAWQQFFFKGTDLETILTIHVFVRNLKRLSNEN